jgi:hypothetical protein
MKGKVCLEHKRPGENLVHGNKGEINHLESCLDNKHWIQKHNFWEVRNGRTTRFWEDGWQQKPEWKIHIGRNFNRK